jgi:sugar-specific transcriptional regulator TrmB
MTANDAAMAKLREIGLTSTEIKVYLALMRGEGDAKKLSQESGVPYSKIHTVLSKLVRKSLAVESKSRPSMYSTKRHAEALLDYKREVVADFERKLKDAEEVLGSLEHLADSEKPDIWIMKNQEGILKRAYKTINEAKKEVKFALPSAPGLVMAALVPVLIRLKAEKVKLKLLLSASAPREDVKKLSELGNIRLRDKMFGGGIIADDNEALLLLGVDGNIPSLAIWSNHAGLVHLARTYFDNLWESSLEPFA